LSRISFRKIEEEQIKVAECAGKARQPKNLFIKLKLDLIFFLPIFLHYPHYLAYLQHLLLNQVTTYTRKISIYRFYTKLTINLLRILFTFFGTL